MIVGVWDDTVLFAVTFRDGWRLRTILLNFFNLNQPMAVVGPYIGLYLTCLRLRITWAMQIKECDFSLI